MSDSERCPICDNPLKEGQETVWWREILEVHQECDPSVHAYGLVPDNEQVTDA